jgi:hypothetical protein
MQHRVDKRPYFLPLKAREAEAMPLVRCTPMALEIDHRDVTTSVSRDHVGTGGKMRYDGLAV